MTVDAPTKLVDFGPVPGVSYDCPVCGHALTATGWHMPGMRPLAALSCDGCGHEYFGDLPAGNAMHAPTLLDRESGETYQPDGESYFFAKWLRESYDERTDKPVEVITEGLDGVEEPAVLNCIDALYGHALLKVFNVQQFVESADEDVVVVVQPNFEWLVPDAAAAVVTVDLPLGRGYEWNEALAAAFRDLFAEYEGLSLCCVDPHPHPSTFDIERYTGVEPLDVEQWPDPPVVTFVWRDDRCWSPLPPWAIVEDRLDERTPIELKGREPVDAVGKRLDDISRRIQRRKVLSLESSLRERFPDMTFVVAGVAKPGGLPERITDLRTPAPDEATERRLCQQYAGSTVVVGVHGSNMLLPSAHAGAAVELLSNRRWGNVLQDLVVRSEDAYDALYTTRLLPIGTAPDDLAACVGSLIDRYDSFRSTLSENRQTDDC
jgi:hypothetical protein